MKFAFLILFSAFMASAQTNSLTLDHNMHKWSKERNGWTPLEPDDWRAMTLDEKLVNLTNHIALVQQDMAKTAAEAERVAALPPLMRHIEVKNLDGTTTTNAVPMGVPSGAQQHLADMQRHDKVRMDWLTNELARVEADIAKSQTNAPAKQP
jgi:hypothetical protein